MKKRLLITSVVMMLVVAVALATSTYAWFTSNSSVTASTVTMTAAVNTEASIGIAWTESGFASSITANSPANGKYFVPTAISSKTADAALTSMIWSSATVRDESDGPTFNTQHRTGVASNDITGNIFDGDNLMTYTYTGSYGETPTDSTTVYINNGSTTNDLTSVVAKVAITGEAREFMRVAIFRNDGSEGAFQLKGIMADRYTYTAAGTGTTVDGTKYYDATGAVVATGDGTSAIPADSFTRSDATGNSTTAIGTVATDALTSTVTGQNTDYSINCGALSHTATMQLKVVVWMDGHLLTDASAGTALARKAATIALTFDASR